MDKSVERLTLAVSEQGLPFARVRPSAARDAAGSHVSVTYLVDEGPHIYIERINVIGNVRTRDYVIRREFRLAEGDAFNPQMVDKAKKRLQSWASSRPWRSSAGRARRLTASSWMSSWWSSRPASCRSAPAIRPVKA